MTKGLFDESFYRCNVPFFDIIIQNATGSTYQELLDDKCASVSIVRDSSLQDERKFKNHHVRYRKSFIHCLTTLYSIDLLTKGINGWD